MAWLTSNSKTVMLALVGAFLAAAAAPAEGQPTNSASNAMRIEGTWRVQVTLRNCATNAHSVR